MKGNLKGIRETRKRCRRNVEQQRRGRQQIRSRFFLKRQWDRAVTDRFVLTVHYWYISIVRHRFVLSPKSEEQRSILLPSFSRDRSTRPFPRNLKPRILSRHAQLEIAREKVGGIFRLTASRVYKSVWQTRARLRLSCLCVGKLSFSKDVLVVIIVRLWYNDSRLYNLFYIERWYQRDKKKKKDNKEASWCIVHDDH